MTAAWFLQYADRMYPWTVAPALTFEGAFIAFVWILVAGLAASMALWVVAALRCL